VAPSGPTKEATIATGLKPASWSYAEQYVGEDEILTAARARAADMPAPPISPGGGATLRFVAALLDAKNVVEIGTGCGVSGLWLMRGMRADGVLTSVDLEAEHQRAAKIAFTEAGIAAQRARLIPGAALEVLPRLTDGHYDVVFCDGDKQEYPQYLEQAMRLLRPGGAVAFDNALWHDRVADSSARDADTTAIRETLRLVSEDESLLELLLPVGDGLLVAQKR
jgi:predicted O-methyltransferase YrrM